MSTRESKTFYELAIKKAYDLQAKKDSELEKVKAKYNEQLREANDEAAAAHKAWLDAEAIEGLKDRPAAEAKAVANVLGLSLPEGFLPDDE